MSDPAGDGPASSRSPDRSEPPERRTGSERRHGPEDKRRMLIIVNPYATTVSDRLKNLVVYALQGRYEVEAKMTEARDHATEIGREAVQGGYDVVCAFGGDGTLNEVANGLAGTDVPVTVLPGGSTNVVCRTLGIPNDVVEATEHLLQMADDFHPRKVDLGLVDDRRFVFSCGVGLDATVVRRVDAHPRLKAQAGEYYYTWAAVSGFYRHYMRSPVQVRFETGDHAAEGITVISQNSDPFTYFGRQPIRVCDDVDLESATLSCAVLARARQRDMPTAIARVFTDRLRASAHRQVSHFAGLTEATVTSISADGPDGALRPFPVQVDGDYIGERTQIALGVEPGALTLVS
ncbi:MAG: diacylglycerol/lipid kinase family protein [Solirubrobacterales bacterium]